MPERRSDYLIGAHMYRVPSQPLEAIRADLATMRSLGMNLANLQVSWSWCNPEPGVYDFADVVELLDEARTLGLQASISLTMEQMPKWVWDRHPDARLVNALDQPLVDPTQYLLPADGKPGPYWGHEGVRAEAERFLRELVSAVDGYANLVYWDTWQEIGFQMVWPGAGVAERNFPFNPEALDDYREWLRDRYGSLDRLNGVWHTRCGSWEEIDPPRLYYKVPSYPDWRQFVYEEYLPSVLRERTRIIHSAEQSPRDIVYHTNHPIYGSTVEFGWSSGADAFGTSFYPTAALYWAWERDDGPLDPAEDRHHELWSSLYQLNYSRCAAHSGGARFILAEMACGPYNSGLTVQGEVSREDMRRWLLLQLTAGAQTTVLWNTRPEHFWDEAQGQGFLGGRGELTPRADAIREYCAAAATHSDLLATSVKPPSPVAICLDESLYRIADGMDERRAVEMPTRGAYEVLFAAGIDPDFIDIERASDTKLDAHRVLVLPFPFATAPTTIAKLRAYVERGGTVLSGPTPGRFSEYGWAWPPGMAEEAEELFGVRQAGLRHVAEFDGNARWTPDGCRAGDILPPTTLAGAGPLAGLSPKAAYYVQTYDIVTDAAEPILRHGDAVAGVRCRHGAGQACVLGTMFAYSTLGEECRETRRAVEAILTAASVPTERTGSIVRHRRVSPGGELWSLVNLGATDAEWRVPEALDAGPVDFLTGERFGRGDAAMVPAHDLRTLVVR